MLAILSSLGFDAWNGLQWRHSGELSPYLNQIALVLLEFGLIYNWMVITYNLRHPPSVANAPLPSRIRPVVWLDSTKGQLITALVGTAVPLATLITLLGFPHAADVEWGLPVNIVFLLVWYVAMALLLLRAQPQ